MVVVESAVTAALRQGMSRPRQATNMPQDVDVAMECVRSERFDVNDAQIRAMPFVVLALALALMESA
jgi:hypothetical protein